MAIKFKITEEIVALEDYNKSFRLELNKVSWNDRDPKYDLRQWNEDHTEMRKGITLNDEQFNALEEYIMKKYSIKE